MKLRKALAAVFFTAVMVLGLSVTVSAAEKSSAKTAKTYAADKASIAGKWHSLYHYLDEDDEDEDVTFYFYKSGKLKVTASGETTSGKYTVKNGLLSLTVEGETIYLPAVIDGGGLVISSDPIDKAAFKPYKTGTSVEEYLGSSPIILVKEKPVPANQEDILGAWVCTEKTHSGTEEKGITVFGKKSTTLINVNGETVTEPMIIKNGLLTSAEKPYGNISSNTVYLCGGKLCQKDGGDTYIYEKYRKKKLTDKILEGASCENGYVTMYFKDGKLHFKELKEIGSSKYTITDKGELVLKLDGEKMTFKPYITDNYIYLVGDEATVIFTRKK